VTAGAGGLGAGGAHGGAAGAEGGAASPADGAYFDGESRLDGLPETTCTVNVTSAELSPHIATVGIVTFTASLPGLTAAEIHFGPDLDHGLVAPVDLADPGHRALLLGMDQDRTYHFRVAVSDGSSVCYGADATLETGSLHAEGLAEASTGDGAAPGFIVTSRDGKAVIYDRQGELVWAYDLWNVLFVQMSWDGRYLIGRDPGPFDLDRGGTFYRVEMDGSGFVTLDAPGGDHHDFAAIPGASRTSPRPARGSAIGCTRPASPSPTAPRSSIPGRSSNTSPTRASSRARRSATPTASTTRATGTSTPSPTATRTRSPCSPGAGRP